MRDNGPQQVWFWFLALVIGVCAGLAALSFRLGIEELQAFLYQTEDVNRLRSWAETLPWYWILVIPMGGGLVVGVILNTFTPDGRVRAVADVIEGSALSEGRVEMRAGLGSALASFITLSTGGSTGREGPVVHLAAVISTWISTRINASGITGRDLLGCAVAGAVSASFNAPIAGALFALEVVLRHFAVHAFAPIAIAAVSGTVINRLRFGDVTEFILPREGGVAFYVELPAFLLLGVVAGIVAVLLMRSVFVAETLADHFQKKTGLPPVLRPALAGLLLGGLAIWFPHIIGVGYETMSDALTGRFLFHEAVVFVVLKIIAVAITMAGRMGGGMFSPALMVGALTGLAFGLVATALLPEVSGYATVYALAGMGAVAAAVLGAPISTTLIVFELTGDWQTGIAVMVSVSLSSAIASRIVDRSFFLTQLERRGKRLAAGPHVYLLSEVDVGRVMRKLGDADAASEETCWNLIEKGTYVDRHASLDVALGLFDTSDSAVIPVVTISGEGEAPELWGSLHHVDALMSYNRALAETAAEEHS
ncbi:MAG: voltage-gated chloride channel [Rhodobacterales bacterium]|nr:MAG: voltage-gated chloride channel [Rhodobacterales bacterium]